MLQSRLKDYTIILASGSPRRQQLLKDLHIDFKVNTKKIDEIYPKELKAENITEYLAELKTKPFLSELKQNDILITSDTIVWLENEALGKPKNYDEAFLMLKRLSGVSHQVITSVCIKGNSFQKIISDITKVTFRKLSDEEIKFYITTYEPYDKAGSYGIQEWIGKIGITKIEGSYFNVMGLPIYKLYKVLLNL